MTSWRLFKAGQAAIKTDRDDERLARSQERTIAILFISRHARGAGELADQLETSLSAIANDYDLILMDTPPGRNLSSGMRPA